MLTATRRYAALSLLLGALVGCGCDRAFTATPQAWEDMNRNGGWDMGEIALQGVSFTASDQRRAVLSQPTGYSDISGRATLSSGLYGCSGNPEWVVEAQPPVGYEGTTPLRLRANAILQFGFAPMVPQ